MITGLIFLLTTGMGIVCGWQPMPDGDASYECVIQLEPELVSTLKSGNSIPLSVDIPDHVRPVKRVRIVIGSGPVPQQSLVTNLKPWSGDHTKQSREGIVEAQYTYPNNARTNPGSDNRYSSQNAVTQPVLPPGNTGSNAQDNFARSLQNGGQAVRDAVTQTSQDILPPNSRRNIADAVDRTGQQLGNEVRNVGESVRSDIRQLFGASSTNDVTPYQPADNQDSQILPPGSNAQPGSSVRNDNYNSNQEILPPGEHNNYGNRQYDQQLGVNRDWQSSGTPVNNQASQSNPNYNSAQEEPRTGLSGGSAPPFNGLGSNVYPQSDRYSNSIPAPERNGLEIADSRNGSSEPPAASGPGFPEFTPSAGGDSPSPRQATQMQSSVPEIRRDMLNRPATAELQGANGQPIAHQNSGNSSPGNNPTTPTSTFDWNTQAGPQSPQQTAQSGANSAPIFPLLLSWVLLSGSGAGNLYLFWSYLDIRNKYRDVLYEASRKMSGRHGRD